MTTDGTRASDGLDQRTGHRADGDDDRDGHAALPGGAEAGRNGSVGRRLHVGVGQDDHVILGPTESLHPFALAGPVLVNGPGDGRAAHEGDCGHPRMVQQRADGHGIAVDHVEHTVGQPGLPGQFGQQQ